MKKAIIILFLFIPVLLNAANYYVAPTGNDSNPGTITQPFATWHYAFNRLNAGDILYVRGGTYYPAGILSGGAYCGARMTGRNGTSGSPITITAYPNETPILDCRNITQSGWKVGLSTDYLSYVHFIGLTIQNVNEHGFQSQPADGWVGGDMNHVTIERCTVTRSGYGFRVGGSSDYVYYINCDSYNNADILFGKVSSGGSGGYCDGFGIHNHVEGGHFFYTGCRAWNNSDDGWDIASSGGIITWTNCWALENGHTTKDWNVEINGSNGAISGDGNGFKTGPKDFGSPTGENQRILYNCVSAFNDLSGFDANSSGADIVMKYIVYNCVAYNNLNGGYHFVQTGVSHTFKNCISLNAAGRDFEGNGVSIEDHNTWNAGFTVSNADFVSVNSSGLYGSRQADGSLPGTTFLKLVSGSNLIDAGIVVGLPYAGKSPDLGANELQNGSAAPVPVPVFISAVIENTTPSVLAMTYDLSLNNLIVPPASSFIVLVNSVASAVNSLAISGTKVQLTLASAVKQGDIISVSYTKPANNPLQIASGAQATNLTAQLTVNKIAAPVTTPTTASIKMTINPNPVHQIINILFEYTAFTITDAAMSPQIVRIFNTAGKLYTEKIIATGIANIRFPINLRPGIYTVVVLSGGLQMATQKMRVY